MLQENLEGHLRKCPLLKQVESLTHQPFYQKGINAGKEERETLKRVEDSALADEPKSGAFNNILSEMKRTVYSMSVPDFQKLIEKIESVHKSICKDIQESYKIPDACGMWSKREVDRYVEAGMVGLSWRGLFDYVRISCCLQKIAISRETCYAAGVDSRKHGRFWAVEEFHSKGEG